MVKKENIIGFFTVTLVLASLLLSACTSTDNNTSSGDNTASISPTTTLETGSSTTLENSRGQYRQNGTMMNLTPEERQKMLEERQQMAAQACQDKAEGDGCTITDQRGDRSGTCQTQQDKLVCVLPGFDRQGPRTTFTT